MDETNNTKERYKAETNNLEFKTRRVEFFPEDVEKMKNMTLEEQNDFMLKLKIARRYTVVED